MLVYAGIDEAGYGPLLGPLCVGLSVFRIEGHDPAAGAPDLWKHMRRAVCRSRRDRRHRIAVEDSKKLKGPPSKKVHPLRFLERGVLSFMAAEGSCPESDDELFERTVDGSPAAPWYRTSTPLPLALEPGELAIAASRLARTMTDAGIVCEHLGCEAIDAGPFNERVSRTGNKATVNMTAALCRLEQVWRRWPDDHPRVIIDRQGGRTHYREDLQLAWPDARIRILAESEAISRYRLDREGSLLTVSFVRDAESGHLPVALASMVAKYVRELFMLRMNRFFIGHLPELKPTAGYYTDARRYLEDIETVVRRLDLPRPQLVRSL